MGERKMLNERDSASVWLAVCYTQSRYPLNVCMNGCGQQLTLGRCELKKKADRTIKNTAKERFGLSN